MHLVTIPTDLDMGAAGVFQKDTYLMEDRNAAELMLMFPSAGIRLERAAVNPAFSDGTGPITVAGGMGFGDAIMLTPVLRELAKTGRGVKVACLAHFRPVFQNLEYVSDVAEWPMRWINPRADIRLIEGFERHPSATEKHMTDVFAEILGVTVTDHRCDFIISQEEKDFAATNFPRVDGRRRVGIQVQASHRCRTYNPEQLRVLLTLLARCGWEVYLMGRAGEFALKEQPQAHLYDLSRRAPSFRDSAAFLTTCDAFIGPDSGFLHVAGALGIPAIGLFSVFPWKLRTSQYPSVFALQAEGQCAPCFHSPTRLQPPFPRGGPCQRTGFCTVLADISPERILQKVRQMVEK